MKVILTLATPEEAIGENAKICYATKALEAGGKDITSTLVHGNSHLAALRFAYATVHIEGISVACQNQFVRSSHLSYMVQSKRYVSAEKGEFSFILPEDIGILQQKAMSESFEASILLYTTFLEQGMKKEDARAILPANTSTKMNATGNLQGWWDFFALRINSHAQGEIRAVAEEIYRLLSEAYPSVFTDAQLEVFRAGH